MREPSKAEIKEIEAEEKAEKGRGVEFDNSEDIWLRKKKAYLNRIDEHIIRGGMLW